VNATPPSTVADVDCSDADVKEKVSRCVKQAFIDPEDFKGVRP
jgi:hypothetical protein